MLLFTVVTLTPCILVGLGAAFGGEWAWLAVAYMVVLINVMDRLIAVTTPENPDPEAEFPAANALLVTLGICHFALLATALWAVAGPSGLLVSERILLGIGAGLIFGQISHPVAHELIHKPKRAMRLLGRLIYTSLLVGHHASAHLLIHHIHVGSDADPNSARKGENFYRFALRAFRQSFEAGLKAETARHKRAGKSAWGHPYLFYVGGAVATLLAAYLGFGLLGFVVMVALATHAQMQILMSDYVQHYGLRRQKLPNGRLEPVGPQHSWNAPDIFSSALMVNAPRHSDHHVQPNRNYPALQLDPDAMPMLPYPLPVMGAVALVPRLWFRRMNPLCDRWQDQGRAPVSPAPAKAPLPDLA